MGPALLNPPVRMGPGAFACFPYAEAFAHAAGRRYALKLSEAEFACNKEEHCHMMSQQTSSDLHIPAENTDLQAVKMIKHIAALYLPPAGVFWYVSLG